LFPVDTAVVVAGKMIVLSEGDEDGARRYATAGRETRMVVRFVRPIVIVIVEVG
jgi:hypothetical protein